MDIEDAFTQEAIEAMDTNILGEEEEEVRDTIRRIYETNQLELTRDHENVAVLCFVAGRTYQHMTKPTGVQITMTEPVLQGYLEFLVQRGAT